MLSSVLPHAHTDTQTHFEPQGLEQQSQDCGMSLTRKHEEVIGKAVTQSKSGSPVNAFILP